MKEINKTWRCLLPFDDKGNILKTSLSANKNVFDDDSAFIFCDNGNMHIDKWNDEVLRLTSFSISKLKSTKTKLDNDNIEVLDYYELDGEGFLDFNYSDVDKVCKLVKAQKQRKQVVGITNIKDNYSLFLRTYRNVNVEYSDKLKAWNSKRRNK